MKNVLVTPHYIETNSAKRVVNSASLGQYLHNKDLCPWIPFFLPSINTAKDAKNLAEKYIDRADSIVFTGGDDINPKFYGEVNYSAHGCLDFMDLFEMELAKLGLEKKLPMLGICRGMQIINTILGGNLHQNLDTPKFQKHDFMSDKDYKAHPLVSKAQKDHTVKLASGGLLAKFFNNSEIGVNSYHHQGIKNLGNGLEIEAQSEDGLIEAFSSVEKKILAVQWHPEMDLENPEDERVLDCWVENFVL